MADKSGLNVFIGCGDRDEHIDIEIAAKSAALFQEAGATVDFRRYPGITHTILDDEVEAARVLVANLPIIGPRPAVS
jgi:predicted esterase